MLPDTSSKRLNRGVISMYDYYTLWEKDMSTAIINEDLNELGDEYKKGWSVNEPNFLL
jgi:hypothetical protein